METTVILSWTFSPADYFEAAIEIRRDTQTILIADGRIEASVSANVFDANPGLQADLRETINAHFLGAQLECRRPFQLSGAPNVTRVHPDGRRDYTMIAEPGRFALSGGSADLKITDRDGRAVVDTKRDRIERKRDLAELAAAHDKDQVLVRMLNSFDKSVRDPQDELVHLYEVRDALVARFGGEVAARAAINFDKKRWSTFGRLCNDEPLKQGRHRGAKLAVPLRDATENELQEVRCIARCMIEAYARSL